MDRVEAVSPVTGQVLASFPAATVAVVERAVSRARAACTSWGQTPLAWRLTLLARLRNLLVNDIDRHEQIVAAATGKPDLEALAGDHLAQGPVPPGGAQDGPDPEHHRPHRDDLVRRGRRVPCRGALSGRAGPPIREHSR